MADLRNYKHVKLTEIATVERAVTGKTYPAGTVYIQVSACHRTGLQQFYMLKERRELETKFAVVLPHDQVDPVYLLEVLNRHADAFMARYVGTNINIQMDSFELFELDYHPDVETQKAIAEALSEINKAVDQEAVIVDRCRDVKAYLMAKMFL